MKRIKPLLSNPNFYFTLLIILNLVVGSLIVKDFGISIDEPVNIQFGKVTLEAYKSPLKDTSELYKSFPERKGYLTGPFYPTFASLFEQFSSPILKTWGEYNFYHYAYLLSFLIGLVSIYIITKRLVNPWIALAATILFNTQPLLLGHAFINPKDIPFMGFFLAAIATGMVMVDKFSGDNASEQPQSKNISALIAEDKASLTTRKAIRRITPLLIWLVILLVYIIFNTQIEQFISSSVEKIYYADPSSFLGKIVQKYAESLATTPLEKYINKGINAFNKFAVLGLLASFLVIFPVILFRVLPKTSRNIWGTFIKPIFKEFNRNLPRKVLYSFKNKSLLLAAVALGLCISIRVPGLATFGLVALYFLIKANHRAVATLLSYSIVGALVAYLTWPYLWGDSLFGIITNLGNLSSFPWTGYVLFNGELIRANRLPISYLPTLLSIQFTEPVIGLSLLGIIASMLMLKKRILEKSKLTVLYLWLFAPLLLVLVIKPTMYDNFRHFLFIIPPIFIFAGIALDYLAKIIKRKWITAIVIIFALIPGIFSSVKLHPYQYTYFNSFVGGVEGAFRRFELDYWDTSFQEAFEYINQTAESEAQIIVWGSVRIAKYYAREDLVIVDQNKATKSISEYDYAILHTRSNTDLKNATSAPIVFQVVCDNAVLVIVLKLK